MKICFTFYQRMKTKWHMTERSTNCWLTFQSSQSNDPSRSWKEFFLDLSGVSCLPSLPGVKPTFISSVSTVTERESVINRHFTFHFNNRLKHLDCKSVGDRDHWSCWGCEHNALKLQQKQLAGNLSLVNPLSRESICFAGTGC